MTKPTPRLRMKVSRIFRFGGGKTVFAGLIYAPEAVVHACTCELLVNGVRRQVLRLEGEMLSEPAREPRYRSVSTKEKVDLEPFEAEASECLLEEVV